MRRWARRVAWVGVAVLGLWGLGWLAVPPLLKWQLQKIASEQLGRAVQLGQVDFKPWTLELTLSDLSVAAAAEAGADAVPQFSVQRVYLNAELQSLLRLAPVVDAIQVQSPRLRLTHLGQGRYDVDDVLSRLAARPQADASDSPARFALYNIDIQDGQLDFDDQSVGRVHELRQLRLSLPFISNLPSQREVKVQPHLAFVANGSAFDSHAQALPFADSRETDAVLSLQQLDLAPYLGYWPAGLNVRPLAATLDADLRLSFEQTPQPSLNLSGQLALSDVKLADGHEAEAFSLKALRLNLAGLRPLQRQLHLDSVVLEGPDLLLKRDAQGQLNWLAGAGDSAPSGEGGSAAPAPATDWQVRLDTLSVQGGRIELSDEGTLRHAKTAAALQLSELNLKLEQMAWPMAQPMRLAGSAALAAAEGQGAAEAARIEWEGSGHLEGAELSARLAGVPLELAAPYLAEHLSPRLSGQLNAQLALQWAPPKEDGQPPAIQVKAEALSLKQVLLADPAKRGGRADAQLASLGQLSLADVQMDWPQRTLSVGSLRLQSPRLTLARDARQRWMYEDWLRPQAAPATGRAEAKAGKPRSPAADKKADAPWKVQLAELNLDGGALAWRDAAMPRPVQLDLSQLQLSAKAIDLSAPQKPVQLNLRTRVAAGRSEPGRIGWRGQVGLPPRLSAQGQLEIDRLPVHALEPYFGDVLQIDLLRADTSFKGQLAYTHTAQGPRAQLKGEASVHDLRTHSRPLAAGLADALAGAPSAAASASPASPAPLAPTATRTARAGGLGDELLSFKRLRLQGLDVQLAPGQPPQLQVQQTELSDFYARLIIQPNGRINLQDLTAAQAQEGAAPDPNAAAGAAEPVAQAAAQAMAQPASAPASAAAPDPMAPVIHFGPTRLSGGKVDFSDRFIRPNYSADLSELQGSLGAFSSQAPDGQVQMAELELSGRAEGTAALQIKGRLNPLAKPLALDIQAQVSDLELPPLSPYSVKYAGHGIERGKLSMDVAYAVQPDGQLTASNKLVLRQLTFGEPVDGAPASLPVRLATALLSDSQGVIDLDLPIRGSLNDPQFSLGPIIFKAIVNLIGKAITAPFTLLARALGGDEGQDMSHVAFAPGSAELDSAARQQLDQIAKALTDRPALKLTVVGTANLAQEAEGYRRQRLKALVAAEQRAAQGGTQAGLKAPATDAPSDTAADEAPAGQAGEQGDGQSDGQQESAAIDSNSPDYAQQLRRLYRRADLPGKPRNAIGLQKDIPVAEMEALLMQQIDVDEDAMRQLATQRGVAVKDYLLARQLPADRLFLGAARAGQGAAPASPAASADADGQPAPAWSPRAELNLDTR